MGFSTPAKARVGDAVPRRPSGAYIKAVEMLHGSPRGEMTGHTPLQRGPLLLRDLERGWDKAGRAKGPPAGEEIKTKTKTETGKKRCIL